MKTTIEIYKIRIQKKDGFVNFGEDPDFFNVLSDEENGLVHYLNHRDKIDELKRTFSIPKSYETDEGTIEKFHHKNAKERYITGVIFSGGYGQEFEVIDGNNPLDSACCTKQNQVIMKPYFYYLKIPRHGDEALLILERVNGDSIRELMSYLLMAFLNDYFKLDSELTIEMDSVILNKYLDILNGLCLTMDLTASRVHTDIADNYFGNLQRFDFEMQITVKIKSKSKKYSNLQNLIESDLAVLGIPNFVKNVPENSMRDVVVLIDGSRNSKAQALYWNLNKKMLYYEIDVEQNVNNFSSYRSIKEVVRNFIQEHAELNIFS